MSCLDNLLKGAASQAVQNFNVASGLDETTRACCDGHGDAPTVLKLGGELLEAPDRLAARRRGRRALAVAGPADRRPRRGQGDRRRVRAVAGLPSVAVDGLRVTDEATLDAVVAVLAGTINTRLVAALVAAGRRAPSD